MNAVILLIEKKGAFAPLFAPEKYNKGIILLEYKH